MNRLHAYLNRLGEIIANEDDPTGRVIFEGIHWFILAALLFIAAQVLRALI